MLVGAARHHLGAGRHRSGSIFAFDIDLFTLVNQHGVRAAAVLPHRASALTVIAALIVTKTRLGRHVQAVGGDDRAAARAGISVKRCGSRALLLSAFGAGHRRHHLCRASSAAPRGATGLGLEFQVYAALMIGGYSILRGGVGNPIGGALGLLAVAGVANILDLKAISPYYVNIIVGLLLLAAVLLDRLRGGDAYE